jgi:hypothetical protein
MRNLALDHEWSVIQSLLPTGWIEKAKTLKAFQRARHLPNPGTLLRLLLFHVMSDGGLRASVAQASVSGIATISQVALLKRMKKSVEWLTWIGTQLCRAFREDPHVPKGMRLRAIDSTTVQGPASKGTEWRVHYSLDLKTLSCDWFELTDQRGAELLERTPMQKGDVILADRNYLRTKGIQAVEAARAYVIVRLKWKHSQMVDTEGKRFQALDHARKLEVDQVGEWPVSLLPPEGKSIQGRVIITKLPAAVAAKAERRKIKQCKKKGGKTDPRSIEAANYVMLFTTLPTSRMAAPGVLELYRYRWQIEIAFKRHKQLLKLGRLPHQDPLAARAWIQAKLVVILLLETLHRNVGAFSPWGYRIENLKPAVVSP